MHIGIFTYGTRGDVEPYISLVLAILSKGHTVLLAAPENFQEYIEGYGIEFHPLHGNVEAFMNGPEGTEVMKAGNTIDLLKFFYEQLAKMKVPLRKSYIDGVSKVDYILANQATLPIVAALAEKQNKKMALSYFMPPMAMTSEVPVPDLAFFNFPAYNRLTYKMIYYFYWKFVKKDTNEFRKELGLPELEENLLMNIEKKATLDLYSFSPLLIAQPKDWLPHHQITGFLPPPPGNNTNAAEIPKSLSVWLQAGVKPFYMGFGSNAVGDPAKICTIIEDILSSTQDRILFVTGWAIYPTIIPHPNLYVIKSINHDKIFPFCKAGIYHGGAGTMARLLRHNLPLIVISFYTDQPTWGKIIEGKKLGVHIPYKKVNSQNLISAINKVQVQDIVDNVREFGKKLREENGIEKLLGYLIQFFQAK